MGLRSMGVDEFLSYDTRSRSEFLDKEWKEKGFLRCAFHRSLPFSAGVLHRIPRIDVRDDKETHQPKRMILTGNYRCIEDEDVIKDQYRRDRETGERRNPPVICPPCLLIEYVHTEVREGRMHWLEPIFDFDCGDPQRRLVIRASGLWNGYKPDRLNDLQKEELAEAGISPMFGWKESIMAGVQYVMCIVDLDAPAKGVQIMREGAGLGDKVKLAIAKEMRRHPKNKSLGDPVQNPYAFEFSYNKNESPQKRYDAYPIDMEITDQVMELIDSEAPSIGMLAGDYSPGTLRSQLERAALIELPWDRFFTPEAEAILGQRGEVQAPPPPPPARSVSRPTVPQPHAAPQARRPAPVPQAPQGYAARAPAPLPVRPHAPPPPRAPASPPPRQPPAQEALFQCDATEGCTGVMRATDPQCPECGALYEVEAPQPPPQPKPSFPKRREIARPAPRAGVPATRGQVVAPAQAAPPSRALPRAPSAAAPRAPVPRTPAPADEVPPASEDDVGFGDFGEDQIPFIHCAADRLEPHEPRWLRW